MKHHLNKVLETYIFIEEASTGENDSSSFLDDVTSNPMPKRSKTEGFRGKRTSVVTIDFGLIENDKQHNDGK